ncbi:hypothetical protein GCM10009765_44460 [Fodinicola feengrottensis]|uniref:Helix-turn-helix domain-containing protein n=1 Tax=Fodinicola feengrottensis TaxID=435914 RepID=A0ABN2HM86_9ACTN
MLTNKEAATGKQLLRISEAMHVLSMTRSVMYELIRCGRLRTVKEGRTRLVPAAAIAEYVALLEQESGQSAHRRAA